YKETLGELWRVARAVWRLNRLGLSHGDLLRSNIGLNSINVVVVLDLDQAGWGHPLHCFLRDFIGLSGSGRASRFSMLDRFAEQSWFGGAVRLLSFFKRKAGSRKNLGHSPWDFCMRSKCRGNEMLTGLTDAWRIGAESGANSPGRNLAYYSLDIDGLHLPGERPWATRWYAISRAVDFRGKRFVELGCNMGLLSIHAKLGGAAATAGADINARVLDAAAKAATAFEVEVRFVQIDFDNDDEWEAVLGDGDVVSALSVTYWLHDKERFWRYLGRFSEVIFEGHESPDYTRSMFEAIGFRSPAVIGISERARMVYHAVR
ncbi:MAG: hypothetical protein ACREIA_05085, partial [Opitutaceae bacterium]